MNSLDVALLAAAMAGDLSAAKKIVFMKSDDAANVAASAFGCRALEAAVVSGQEDIVGLLLEHGANPNQNRDGRKSAMVLAAQSTSESAAGVLGKLIAAGGDARQKFIFNGASLLAEAARARQAASMELLIAAKASAREVDAWGQTALHAAAAWAGPSEIGILARAGASMDYPYAVDGSSESRISSKTMSPLALASSRGIVANVEALLAKGANANALGLDGRSAMFAAAAGENVDCVAALLAAGGDPNHADEEGLTPLMIAAMHGRASAASELLQAGADPLAKSGKGWSPIIFAAKHGRDECVSLLLDRSSLGEVDVDGEILAEFALAGGCSEQTRRLIVEAAAQAELKPRPKGRPFGAMAALAQRRSRAIMLTAGRRNLTLRSGAKPRSS